MHTPTYTHTQALHNHASMHPAYMGYHFHDNTAPTDALLKNTKKAPPASLSFTRAQMHGKGGKP